MGRHDPSRLLTLRHLLLALALLSLLLALLPPSRAQQPGVSTKMAREIARAKRQLKKMRLFGPITDVIDLILTSLIPLNDVTILLPVHARTIRFFMGAFSSQKQQQLIAYHILEGRYDYRRLRYLPKGRKLNTLEGTQIVKRGRKGGLLVALKGKGGAPVPIVMPNLFNGSQFTIHAVSEMVVPHDIY
ncbi:hypothetical protein CLOM_g13508 [Closterium sp. NIES-68]|nr:hypothetical protein CLOM_g13508 [Closterium sp. NIES-68]GJP78643.1 hypothetical protein CLOP_g8920 [Closterium sp. NIES-67]